MRNLLIAGLAAMSLIAFGACGGDEEETSTKECTSNADCADGKICSADNKCVDDPGVTPGPVAECTTNTDCTDASKPVCDNGTCVADSSVTPGPVDECTTNDDCTDATKPVCDNGTCVADDTQSGNCPAGEYEIDGNCYAEGDECDPEVVTAICAGNKSVMCTAVDILPDYSGYVYGIVVDNCADNGMNCGVISEEGMSYGLCTLPCDAAGEEVYMCDPNPEFEGDLNTYVCYALADGGFGAVYDDYVTCGNGCDSTKNECIKLVSDEGTVCDDTFIERCENDVVVYCNDDSEVSAVSCGNNEACHVDSEGVADCYAATDACTSSEEGNDRVACIQASSYFEILDLAATGVCTKINESAYYYEYDLSNEENYEVCDNGCAEGACIKLAADEGTTCDSTFTERCDAGDIGVYCSNNVVTTLNCGAYGNVCGQKKDENYIDCVEANSCAADDVGTNTYSCDDSYADLGYYYSDIYMCYELEDGGYALFYEDYEDCESTCNATTGQCE